MMTAAEIDRDGMKDEVGIALREQLGWLLDAAGVSALGGTGWIRVTGEDAVRWLNGMVTNSITELKPGDGNYSFALNAQGRIQGDLWAFAEEDGSLLLSTARERVGAMIAMFDRFIIMDDVELKDVSAERFGLSVGGPRAGEVLERVGLSVGGSVRTKAVWNGVEVEVIGGWGPLVPRFEVWTADDAAGEGLLMVLATAAGELGGGVVGGEALEWLRVLEGTPKFGVDIREKELPQETGQVRALHFSKGCYLGQEIVERIRSRGNVHRAFGAFRLEGALPAVGALIESEGKTVGELTSVVVIPVGGKDMQIGLGYVRREAVERGSELTYAADGGVGTVTPVAVPVRLDRIA